MNNSSSIFKNGFDKQDDAERWQETREWVESAKDKKISLTYQEWVKLGQSKAGGGHALTPHSDVAYDILRAYISKRNRKKKSPSKKTTIAQIRKECKEQGLVYDVKTKRCRESKRKKKSPKSKSPTKKKKKGHTIAQIRKECKEQGLVYDVKTKRCRESKKKKKGRKGPDDSATKFNVGTRKRGNDGNMWEIVTNKNGTKRWKKDTLI